MRAVLISIKPKWCDLIASGKKTIEVRKTRPKIDTPFKCYIYKTKKRRFREVFHKGEEYYGQEVIATEVISCSDIDGGKVIGEFVCNKINDIPSYVGSYEDCQDYEISDEDLEKTCLEQGDLYNYNRGKPLYGWHITDLVIYDKPKELSEFWKANICRHLDGGCDICYELCGIAQNNDCHCGHIRLKRPPQSWCYVEADNE